MCVAADNGQDLVAGLDAVYEPLLEAGREIVSIHISSGISGTFEAAGQARQRLVDEGRGGERIRVMDSRSAAGGMGLAVLGAAAAAASGGDADAVLARAEQTHEIFGCEPVFVSEIGAVLGAHVGPGLLGIGSVPTSLVEFN